MKYRLTVSGTIEFHEDGRDQPILERLLGLDGGQRLELAIQELEKNATEIVVEMKEVE